jgi:surface antigen
MVQKTLSRIVLPVMLAAALLAGCQQTGTKQTVGGLAGAVGGGVIGSQIGRGTGNTAAIIAGTVLGGLLGSEVGKSLDTADRMALQQAQSRAHYAPINEPIAWSNPDSGNHGYITPVREGRQQTSGHYCREYQTSVVIDGRQQSAYGTACRQPDGSWEVVS